MWGVAVAMPYIFVENGVWQMQGESAIIGSMI